MNMTQITALLPLIALASTVVAVMSAIAVKRHHGAAFAVTVIGLIATLVTLIPAAQVAPQTVTPLFIFDEYALFFIGLFTAAALATVLLSFAYLADISVRHEEYYLLLALTTLGAAALAAANHLASLFLSLETTSVALFALIAYRRDGRRPVEAGIKYLVLVGVSTALLTFGLALFYAATGVLAFDRIGQLAAAGINYGNPILLGAFLLIVVGLGFKLSLVPFHLWTPDVYQGAPAPVTGFLATVSKGAVFAVLLRYLDVAGADQQPALYGIITIVAIASMLIGNWLALLQDNLKRLLAYSSIAHLGYLLVPLLAGGALGVEAAAYYLVAYFITTLGAFAVITVLSAGRDGEAETLSDYQGLFWRRPWLAGVMTLMLLSLAGIPLTAGFIAKFYALAGGVEQALWLPVLALVAGSAIGLFYYLRVVIVMTRQTETAAATRPLGLPAAAALLLLTAALIGFGVYPAPLIAWLPGLAAG